MNTCWQILNIAPTNDSRAIRKAYAALLKTTRPDDNAAAYQTLREAFDEALRLAPEQSGQRETDFRQPENDTAETAAAENDPCTAWVAQVANIINQDGAAGLIRARMDLTAAINSIDEQQRGSAERYWLDYLRTQNRSLPLLWTFGASWFGWWDENDSLNRREYNQLHGRKYHEADWVHSPEAVCSRLLDFDDNPKAMQNFWRSYPDEIAAFTEQERQQMGLLLRHWRERSDLPETLRHEWQARYPEFDQELPPQTAAQIDTWLTQLQQAHTQGGTAAVWAMQAQTDALLDSLPPPALLPASQKMLELLRNWQTQSVHLWHSWGMRFNWQQNPFSGCQLNETEREYFYHQRHLFDIFHSIPQLAEYLDDTYRQFGDGRTEIDYIWRSLKDDLWAFSPDEASQLHDLMRYYLQHLPHRLSETVFTDWYALTENNTPPTAFRQPENPTAASHTPERQPETKPPPVFAATLTPQDVHDYVQNLYRGNSSNLSENWPQIRAMLEQLPLGTVQNASPPLLHFLRQHHIDNPIVWAQWADYFGWAGDYQSAHLFSVQEMEELKMRLETAALLMPTAETTTPRPITRGLQAITTQGKTFQAAFFGWLLHHDWQTEWNSEQRKQTIHHTALRDISDNSETLQVIWLVCLMTAAFIAWLAAPDGFGGDVFMLILTVPLFCSAAFFAFWGILAALSDSLTAKIHRLLHHPKISWAIGVALPALSIIIWTLSQYPPLQIAFLHNWFWQYQPLLEIDLLAIVLLSWNLHALNFNEKHKWIIFNTLFIGIIALSLPIEGWGWDRGLFTHSWYTLLWAILWLNTALLLRPHLPQTGSLKLLADLICLPHALMQQLQHKPLTATLEQAAWVLLILSAAAHYTYPLVWLGFYPAIIGIILCGQALKHWARRRIAA